MSEPFDVIIAGSRDCTREQVFAAIAACKWIKQATGVVSGTARGADTYGEEWARSVGLPVYRYPADWKLHGRSAGYVRNRQMAVNAEALLAVWDSKSRGTAHMIEQATSLGLRVAVWRTDTSSMDVSLERGGLTTPCNSARKGKE